MSMTMKVIAAGCGALMSVGMASGIAAAQPGTEAAVNTTCTYPQVIGALDAQDPAASADLQGNGFAVLTLQGFLAAPPGSQDRRNRIAQVQAIPQFASYAGLVNSVAVSCSRY